MAIGHVDELRSRLLPGLGRGTAGRAEGVAVDLDRAPVRNGDLKPLQHLRSLERLYLPGTRVGDQGLLHIRRLRNLRRLALWNTQISDDGLAALDGLENLRVLDVHGNRLSDGALKHLQGLKALRRLIHDIEVGDAGIEYLSQLPKLQLETLTCVGLTARGFQTLRDRIHVKCLVVRSPTDAACGALLAAHPTLNSLTLIDAALTDNELRQIAEADRLTSLRLERVPVTGAVLPALARAKRLKQLALTGTGVTVDEFLRHLGPRHTKVVVLTNWVRLYHGGAGLAHDWAGPLAGADLDALRYCCQATSLHIEAGRLGDTELDWLAAMPELESARVYLPFDDQALRHAGSLPKLTYLELAGPQHFTPQGLESLRQAKNLRHLLLRHAGLSDDHLAVLGGLRRLYELQIPGNPISSDGLAALRGLEQLDVLNISFCRQLDDPAMPHVAALANLRDLSARDTRITDAGLKLLHGMPRLENITVLGSRCTPQAIRALRDSLPTKGGVVY